MSKDGSETFFRVTVKKMFGGGAVLEEALFWGRRCFGGSAVLGEALF